MVDRSSSTDNELPATNEFNITFCLWFTLSSLMQQGSISDPKVSPYEWVNPHPCNADPDELENDLDMSNAFWHNIGSLMQQGSDIAPKAISTRMVAGTWWFFTLIMISSYTANLAAFLTVEKMDSPIENADDLAKQTKIKYGSMESGTTAAFFRDSKIPTYRKMWSFMESQNPSVFTKSNLEGVRRVQESNGLYAFLMESSTIEYIIERRCDLMQVGSLLDSKAYGIALPPGSPYRSLISGAILQLQEKNILHIMKTKWWKQKKGGGLCKDESSMSAGAVNELGLANVGGVFVVLMGGIAIASIISISEFCWRSKKIAKEDNTTLYAEVLKEICQAIRCQGSKKPIRKKTDGGSSVVNFASFTTDEKFPEEKYMFPRNDFIN